MFYRYQNEIPLHIFAMAKTHWINRLIVEAQLIVEAARIDYMNINLRALN